MTWLEVVQRDCQVCGLSRDDAVVCGRWRKMIRMVDEQEGCEWIDVSSGTGSPGSPGQRAVKRSCVCVCVVVVVVIKFAVCSYRHIKRSLFLFCSKKACVGRVIIFHYAAKWM